MRTKLQQSLASRGIAKDVLLNKLKYVIWFVLLFGNVIHAQNLTLSTSGETGTSGTNWSISGNVLSVTGTASIHVSVITNHLTTVGDLEILANSAVSTQHINIDGAINYTGSTARTLTFVARNDVKVNQAVTTSNTTLHIIAKAGDNIEVASGVSVASNGGNIVFWANTDGDNLGSITAQTTTSIVSNGGGIWMGGGQSSTQWVPFDGATSITVGDASAISGTANPFGVVIRGTVNSGIGNFYAAGSSNKIGTDYSTGVFFDANLVNISIQAKNIRVVGQGSPNTGTAHSNRGVVLEIADNKTGTIQATSELYIEGTGSGTGSTGSYNRGIHLSKTTLGTATITAATIYLKGIGAGASGSNFNDGVSLFGITLGNSQTNNITLEGLAGAFGTSTKSISFQSNVTIGNVTGNTTIQLLGNSYLYTSSVIATKGNLSILSTSNSFDSAYSNASLSITGSPSSITIGKPTNIGDITIASPLTASGSISVIGGILNVGSVITSSNTGDIIIKSNVTNTGATSSLYCNAQILKTGGQRSKLLMQANGRLNFGTAGRVEATNTALDAIFWSDFDNTNNDGGTTVYANVTTNGGHVWIGGSNSTGGSVTWNGLTVGDGPSIGTISSNLNAIDFGSNIITAGGDVFVWAGNGATNGGNVGINGLELYNGDRTINAGTGDITIITNAGVKTYVLKLLTTGKIAIAPNATSFSASTFNFNGTVSGNDFIGTNSMDKISILNYAAVNQLSLGYYTNANGWNFSNNGPIALNIDYVSNGSLRINGSSIALNANLKTQNTGNMYLKGNTTIAAGKQIQCNGNFTHDGNLIFKSNATGTATFGILGGAFSTVSGTATVERFIPQGKRAFRLLSPAVTTTTFISGNWQQGTHITGSTTGANGFDATETGNPSMFTYNNQVASGSGWTPIANTNATSLTAGVGYRVLVRGDRNVNITVASLDNMNAATTLTATGTLKTGTVTLNSSSTPAINNQTNATTADFSLVGNPYQSAIDWNALTKSGIDATYYAWDPNMGTSTQRGRYVAYNGTTNDNVSSEVGQFIQPGQAFFVKNTTSGTAGTLTFQEAHKATSSSSVFRMSNQISVSTGASMSMQLFDPNELGIGGYPIDAMKAVFNADYQNTVGTGDATKLESAGENIAWSRNNAKLAIDAAAPLTSTDELLVKTLRLGANKDYTFKIQTSNFDATLTPYLVDNFLNTQTEITTSQAFLASFATTTNAASYDENRFKIVFTTSALHNDTFTTQIGLYPNPSKGNGFNLQLPSTAEAIVKLFNTLGQEIALTTNGSYYQAVQSLPTGVYYIMVTQGMQTSKLKWIVE